MVGNLPDDFLRVSDTSTLAGDSIDHLYDELERRKQGEVHRIKPAAVAASSSRPYASHSMPGPSRAHPAPPPQRSPQTTRKKVRTNIDTRIILCTKSISLPT
jgi:hypothetical protein